MREIFNFQFFSTLRRLAEVGTPHLRRPRRSVGAIFSSKDRRRKSFTLVEILIASLIFMMVAMTAAASFAMVRRSNDKADDVRITSECARHLESFLTAEVRNSAYKWRVLAIDCTDPATTCETYHLKRMSRVDSDYAGVALFPSEPGAGKKYHVIYKWHTVDQNKDDTYRYKEINFPNDTAITSYLDQPAQYTDILSNGQLVHADDCFGFKGQVDFGTFSDNFNRPFKLKADEHYLPGPTGTASPTPSSTASPSPTGSALTQTPTPSLSPTGVPTSPTPTGFLKKGQNKVRLAAEFFFVEPAYAKPSLRLAQFPSPSPSLSLVPTPSMTSTMLSPAPSQSSSGTPTPTPTPTPTATPVPDSTDQDSFIVVLKDMFFRRKLESQGTAITRKSFTRVYVKVTNILKKF